jgi:hypothetical protein
MRRIGFVGLCAVLALPFSPATGAETTSAEARKTWKRSDEFSPRERALIDFRTERPRDAEIEYLPAEKYPFTAPFTAEELAYRMMNFAHNGRWPATMADGYGTITKEGYLTQGITVTRVTVVPGREGVAGQLHTPPGEEFMRFAYYYTDPPKDRHLQGLWVHKRTDREQRTNIDNFMYVPYMRRVRRMPQFRRDVPFRGMVQTFHDIAGREAWEFSWRVIGSDVLYETTRFPATRPKLTLARADGSFYEVSTSELKMMGDIYPFYRTDGGVECLVLVAEPQRDWLPHYAVSRIVYWIDRHYFYPLRIELYDSEGKLKTVQVRLAKQGNPALGAEGYTNLLTVFWDTDLDLIGYSLHDAYRVIEWSEEERSVMFSPEFMRRCWLKYAQPTHALVASQKEFYLRPSLEAGKFCEGRLIRLADDVQERVAAQEKAGHLVFAASESD